MGIIESKIITIEGALYDSNGHIIGHAPFDKVQVDTLTYQPLADKVLQILTGDPTFHAEDINTNYDEEEGDWDKDVNNDIDVDPIDEYTDKSDVFDMENDLNDKLESVQQSIIKEGINTSDTEPDTEPNNEPDKE